MCQIVIASASTVHCAIVDTLVIVIVPRVCLACQCVHSSYSAKYCAAIIARARANPNWQT